MMERHVVAPRPDWRSRVEETGLTWHSGSPHAPAVYWDETAAYEFSSDEVDLIEEATAELHQRCLDAVERIVGDPECMRAFGLPPEWEAKVRASWRAGEPHVMGRFDLAFDPADGRVSMLEYNADTPTLVIETAVTQWFWLQDTRPDADQFNSLHERLIDRWRAIAPRLGPGPTVFSAVSGCEEEEQQVLYFRDVATQAGVPNVSCPVEEIGWDTWNRRFVGVDGAPIGTWAKLYPWEWLIRERFGLHLLTAPMTTVEPPWKMLLSHKAILPLLWSMFPDHPHLLEAHFSRSPFEGKAYVAKPVLAREGANVRIVRPGREDVATGGAYADQPCVFQAFAPTPEFGGRRVVVGSWIVGDVPAGMILREGDGDIVTGDGRIVPHWFESRAGTG